MLDRALHTTALMSDRIHSLAESHNHATRPTRNSAGQLAQRQQAPSCIASHVL